MLNMLFIILSGVALCLYLWMWLTKSNKDEPPALPGCLPLIGHAYELLGDNVKLWDTVKQMSLDTTELGGVAYTKIGPVKVYCVTDPEDFATISNTCLEKNRYYKYGRPWIGQGLLTGSLEKWKVHRRLLSPTFNQLVIDNFIDPFNKQSRRLVKSFAEHVGRGPFDHFSYIRHNALETICLTAMGVDYNDKIIQSGQYESAIEEILKIIIERIRHVLFYYDFIFNLSATRRRLNKYVKIVHEVSNTILKNRKADYIKNKKVIIQDEENRGTKFKPFMDLILELYEDKNVMTDTEIREHVDTIIVAGYDTSASVLLYAIVFVASYPHVQEKIFEELYDVFGDDNDRDVTKEDLPKLVYLEAVIKESMRYNIITPVTGRNIDRDIKLRNCTLSKGHICLMLGYGIHRHPVWGPDANEFKPERWLDPARIPKIPSAYAAFGVGKRVCVGKSYAYMSMKITLSHIFRKFKVSGDHTKVVYKMDVMLKPKSGHHISIERRV